MKEELFKDYLKRLNALDEDIRDTVLKYAEKLYLNQKCSKDEAIDRAIAKVEMEKRKLQSVVEVDNPSIQPDVIIVGAGLSGLTAASRLKQKGLNVLVLEARNEVGGRTKTTVLNGIPFNMGGQFIGKRHVRMQNLCRALGLHLTINKLNKPIAWFSENKTWVRYLPPISLMDTARCISIFFRLNFMARGINYEQPWQSQKALQYDSISFETWLQKQNVSQRLYNLMKGVMEGYANVPMTHISFLHALWWISRSGGVIRALQDGSKMMVAEGTQRISQALAEKLGEKVLLNNPVVSITQDNRKVKVSTDAVSFTARYAIVTAPIGTLKKITFHPALPENLQEMINNVEASKASAVVALLKKKEGILSDIVINNKVYPLAWRDNELQLKGLTLADLPEAEYSHKLVSCFTQQQDNVEAWAIENWGNNPYFKGTYIVFRPNQLTKFGPLLRQPLDRVFFASAERSSWVNNMEGAVESGELVADQIMKLLIDGS